LASIAKARPPSWFKIASGRLNNRSAVVVFLLNFGIVSQPFQEKLSCIDKFSIVLLYPVVTG
jgi:hypothetical protein